MAERTVATVLRELSQVKAAGLDAAIAGILKARLQKELEAMAKAMEAQGSLELQPPAPPPGKPR